MVVDMIHDYDNDGCDDDSNNRTYVHLKMLSTVFT